MAVFCVLRGKLQHDDNFGGEYGEIPQAGSPVLSAAKVINFVSAMMSVLGLQTAMISKFSEKSDSFRAMMNGITGGVIYGIVIVTAVLMLMKGKRASGNE